MLKTALCQQILKQTQLNKVRPPRSSPVLPKNLCFPYTYNLCVTYAFMPPKHKKKSTKYIFFPLTILSYHVFCCTAKSAVTISNIGAGTRRLLNHFSAHNIIYVWIYGTTQIYDILRMNINLFISLCFILFYFFSFTCYRYSDQSIIKAGLCFRSFVALVPHDRWAKLAQNVNFLSFRCNTSSKFCA